MSAMHWEARRRQSSLDRRVAQLQQQQEDSAPNSSMPSESNPPPEHAGGLCPLCKSSLRTSSSMAKLPNRYSSLQYKQQW